MKLKPLKSPLVSIVMTVYNEAHCVDQAIESLLDQSYKRIELILVNNGSKDNTLEVLRKYRTDKRVRVLSLVKNAGPGGGRNAGAKIAKGEILVFIDADMVFERRYVERLIKPVVTGKAIGSFHRYELVKNTQNVWARSLCVNRIVGDPKTSGVFRAVLRKPFIAAGGFDTSKGYFDDGLSSLGVSVVANATCYHNNPENLREVFFHSAWVGRSLLQNKEILTSSLKRFWWLPVAALIGLAAAVALIIRYDVPLLWVVLAAVVGGWLLLAAKFALRRTIDEKRPEYLVTIPILWVVRILGYLFGMVQKLA